MSPFLRKVKTASGATAVQIVEKRHGVRTILEHLGSAHDEAELEALIRIGRDKLHANGLIGSERTADFAGLRALHRREWVRGLNPPASSRDRAM